jgi:RNA polymerase sigma-70 factor (ECF subfamily)
VPDIAVPADGQLVVAVLAGQREAFAQIVTRYHGPLFRLALNRLGRRDWAEDAVQETFLSAFRWLKTYDSRFSFRTWLWTILLNQCRTTGKKQSQYQPADQAVASLGLVCPEPTPADAAETREHAARLHALLARLPEPQADALRLRYFGELSYPEIAAAMECSVSGAKLRVRSGLAQLSAWLQPADSAALDSELAPLANLRSGEEP